MIDLLATALALAASVTSGLLAGVYFAFSAFVMDAFGRLPQAAAVEAMNAINRVIVRSAFMAIFVAGPLLGVAAATVAVIAWPSGAAAAAVAGAVLVVAASVGVTMVRNVPLNGALERGALPGWRAYDAPWRRWNHVRTAGCTLGASAFALALVLR